MFVIGLALDVAHEHDTFQGSDISSGGDHIDCDGDTILRIGAKGLDGFFRFAFADFVGDLLAEGVAFIEDFAHGFDNAVAVVVVLSKDQGFGHPFHGVAMPGSVGETVFQATVLEGLNDGSDLVGGQDTSVDLGGQPFFLLVEDFQAFLFGEPVADLDGGAGLDFVALLGHLGIDAVDVVADIDLVDNGVLVGVLGNEVLVEKANRLFGGRGGEPDQEGVEVFQDLAPEVVNRAMAFIDNDDIKHFDGDVRVVADRARALVKRIGFHIKAGLFIGLIVQLLAGQLRVQALDGGDGDFGGIGDAGSAEDVDVVVLGELAAIVGDDELFELVLGVGGQVAAIDQEERAFDFGEFGQAVDLGDGGVGFAGSGRHLEESAGFRFDQAAFDALDRVDLTATQVVRVQVGQLLQAVTQGFGFHQPDFKRFWAVEVKDSAGTRVRVALVAELDFVVGRFIDERQRLAWGRPGLHELGMGCVAVGLFGDQAERCAFAFGFDDAACFALDEEHIVGGSGPGVHFAHGDAVCVGLAGAEIEAGSVLKGPAGGLQLSVDFRAGLNFIFVGRQTEAPLFREGGYFLYIASESRFH